MTVCSLVLVACGLGPASDPTAAMLHLSAGARLHVEGRLEDAVAEYDQAIGLDPSNPDAFYNRGLAREEIGESRRALRDFDAALRLKPKQPEALYHRGNVLDDLGSHKEAVRGLRLHLLEYSRTRSSSPSTPVHRAITATGST
jgi:tetratricopeptide (TPR) repeat protein